MSQYYVQVDGIPPFIAMIEDTQKKAKQAGMLIANVELVMMASAAVLEPNISCAKWMIGRVYQLEQIWSAWKVAFCLAHLKHQCHLQTLGGGKPLGRARLMTPAPPSTINHIGTAPDNLALAALNNITVLQKLMAANLTLMASFGSLLTTNKKLAEGLATKGVATSAKATDTGGVRSTNTPFPGNYCWTHRHWVSQHHTSVTCRNKAAGHKDKVASANMVGGSNANEGWFGCT